MCANSFASFFAHSLGRSLGRSRTPLPRECELNSVRESVWSERKPVRRCGADFDAATIRPQCGHRRLAALWWPKNQLSGRRVLFPPGRWLPSLSLRAGRCSFARSRIGGDGASSSASHKRGFTLTAGAKTNPRQPTKSLKLVLSDAVFIRYGVSDRFPNAALSDHIRPKSRNSN